MGNPILKHVPTNPEFVEIAFSVSYMGVRVRVDRMGEKNWHPDGQVWCASIHADQHCFDDETQWAYGLAAWGSSRNEAIINARKFSIERTLNFPRGWLQEVFVAIEEAFPPKQEA